MNDKNSLTDIVRRYLRYLKLERNYSSNTLDAYKHDLDYLLRFLSDRGLAPLDVKLEDLQQFAASLHEQGLTAKSQARILSGIRSFYRYLLLDGYLEVDPTELLESPHLPKHLPEYLTTEEVDRLEAAILRVSELTHLKMSGLYLQEHFIRVTGKGRKERLVPISDKAIRELTFWFDDRNKMNIKPGEEDYVFLNNRGHHLTRTMILIMVKRLGEAAGIEKTISPHTLRHSFARVIQELLGHAGIGTTEIYTHLDNESLRQTVLLHHPRNMK